MSEDYISLFLNSAFAKSNPEAALSLFFLFGTISPYHSAVPVFRLPRIAASCEDMLCDHDVCHHAAAACNGNDDSD